MLRLGLNARTRNRNFFTALKEQLMLLEHIIFLFMKIMEMRPVMWFLWAVHWATAGLLTLGVIVLVLCSLATMGLSPILVLQMPWGSWRMRSCLVAPHFFNHSWKRRTRICYRKGVMSLVVLMDLRKVLFECLSICLCCMEIILWVAIGRF